MTIKSGRTLKVNDRIKLYGGYDFEPLYLKNPPSDSRLGQVIQFIKGQNNTPAAVVRLNKKIRGEKIRGDILIIEPRYADQTWQDNGLGPVHIELCNFLPEDKEWKNRKHGEWIEAAASWEIIK